MFRISRRYKIWKLQRPMYGNNPVQEVLAYTAGAEENALIPMTDYEMHDLFGEEWKIYVLARVVNGSLHVKKRVKEQAW